MKKKNKIIKFVLALLTSIPILALAAFIFITFTPFISTMVVLSAACVGMLIFKPKQR